MLRKLKIVAAASLLLVASTPVRAQHAVGHDTSARSGLQALTERVEALETFLDSLMRTVFVTSTGYTGNLGGVSGADAICNSHAAAAGLPGSYKAWISAGFDSPLFTFHQGPFLYRRTDGAIVAGDWNGLTDGWLNNPINVDENGGTVVALPWTNTRHDGSVGNAGSCRGWLSADPGDHGNTGDSNVANAEWSWRDDATCDTTRPIFCFQQ